MSTATASKLPPIRVDWLLPLLKEYADRLNGIVEKTLMQLDKKRIGVQNAWELAQSDEVTKYYLDLWVRLHKPVKRLIQQASGLAEQGRIDENNRTEMILRLAELEPAFLTAEALFAQP